MRMAGIIPRVIVTVSLSSVACTLGAQVPSNQQANRAQANTSAEIPKLEDVEQRLGPFSFKGENFTVALHEKRFPAARAPHYSQTLDTVEVRDGTGAVRFQKTFKYGVEAEGFERSVKASARLLSGKYFTGLLISYRLRLSTGENAEAWQVFGYQDGRSKQQDARFRVFDKPQRGDYGTNTSAEMQLVSPNGVITKPMVPEGEIFEFRVWTGNFYLFLPVGVDFANGKLKPGMRCAGTGASRPGMHEIGCDMRVEAERKPPEAEMTFLRLFPGKPGRLDEGEAQHLVLDKNSKVEVLKGSAFVDWGLSGDLMQVAFRDLCLQVRIDGDDQKTGWIQSEEDFAAVGLHSRSPEP
jgi:hypothetical protein